MSCNISSVHAFTYILPNVYTSSVSGCKTKQHKVHIIPPVGLDSKILETYISVFFPYVITHSRTGSLHLHYLALYFLSIKCKPIRDVTYMAAPLMSLKMKRQFSPLKFVFPCPAFSVYFDLFHENVIRTST